MTSFLFLHVSNIIKVICVCFCIVVLYCSQRRNQKAYETYVMGYSFTSFEIIQHYIELENVTDKKKQQFVEKKIDHIHVFIVKIKYQLSYIILYLVKTNTIGFFESNLGNCYSHLHYDILQIIKFSNICTPYCILFKVTYL